MSSSQSIAMQFVPTSSIPDGCYHVDHARTLITIAQVHECSVFGFFNSTPMIVLKSDLRIPLALDRTNTVVARWSRIRELLQADPTVNVLEEILSTGVDPTALSEADEEARMEARAAARDDIELAPEIRCQLDIALQHPMDGDRVMLNGVVHFWDSCAGLWCQKDGKHIVDGHEMREYDKKLLVLPLKLVPRPVL